MYSVVSNSHTVGDPHGQPCIGSIHGKRSRLTETYARCGKSLQQLRSLQRVAHNFPSLYTCTASSIMNIHYKKSVASNSQTVGDPHGQPCIGTIHGRRSRLIETYARCGKSLQRLRSLQRVAHNFPSWYACTTLFYHRSSSCGIL